MCGRSGFASGRAARRGFTVVELLVLVAVLSILAALLLPLLQRGVLEARKTVCLNNLHALGAAAIAYADDNNGFLAPANLGWTHLHIAFNKWADNEVSRRCGIDKTRAQNLPYLNEIGYTSSSELYFCPEDAQNGALQGLGAGGVRWDEYSLRGKVWPLLQASSNAGVKYSYQYNMYGAFCYYNNNNAYHSYAHLTFRRLSRYLPGRPLALDSNVQADWHRDSWNLLFPDGHAVNRVNQEAGYWFRLYKNIGQTDNGARAVFERLTGKSGWNSSTYLHGENPCYCGNG